MNLVRIDMISWKFAVGIHFCSVDNWLQQREVFFDTSPLDLEDHAPDMPIDRPIRYATEVQYKWSDRLSTGAQFVYAEYGKVKIENGLIKGYTNEMTFFLS
jgi:long-subunit fatty acid transport protein